MSWIKAKELSVGDEIAISEGYGSGRDYSIATVKIVSPAGQVTLSNGRRFNPDGYERGTSGQWRRSYLVSIDEKVLGSVHRSRLIDFLRKKIGKWESLPTEEMERIADALGYAEQDRSRARCEIDEIG